MFELVCGFGVACTARGEMRLHEDVCERCGELGTLRDYDVELVNKVPLPLPIVTIPISVGARWWSRVLDHCSLCDGHRLLRHEEWERDAEASVDAAIARSQAAPDDPGPDLDLLRVLDASDRRDEAQELAEEMQRRFATDAAVQAALARWHESLRRPKLANPCWNRVLELDPEGTTSNGREAITALAVGAVFARDTDRARELETRLRTREPSDAHHWARLAWVHHQHSDDEAAFGCLRRALELSPALAEDVRFYELAREVDRGLGHSRSLLPQEPSAKQRMRRETIRWYALAALIVIMGVLSIPVMVWTNSLMASLEAR